MAKWQRVRVDIPKSYTPTERVAIANAIVEFSIKRSKAGDAVDGSNFPEYTPEYIRSLNFGIAGKSTGSVNLTLSGEMLNAMDLISHKSGSLLIGYDKGDNELNGKVEGNRIGSYGREADSSKARDFLGISSKDLEKILKKFPKKTEEDAAKTKSLAIDIVTSLRVASEELES